MGAESGPLGFPLPGFTLALDIPMTGQPLLQLLDQLDERVASLGGRLYFAKDSRMNARWLSTMYPRLPEWLAVKRRVDPENVFTSDLSRRLHLHP
jgi:decaprenylphospho-beta-D-ribofuranose 2-oxidase